MSFWSQLNSDHPRRLRPTTTSTNSTARNNGSASSSHLFRETSPETEMFFDSSHPNMTFPRSNLADRWGSSVFDEFPSRRMRTGFTVEPSSPFGSLHRERRIPRWVSGDRTSEGGGLASDSREPSPTSSDGSNSRQQGFHGTIPARGAHSSRSSTPESTGSGSASGKSEPNVVQNESSTVIPPNGVEEHPMANSKPGQQSFTARRTPKVHHIPIHVEPRDGPHPVTVTPPIVSDVESTLTTGPSFPTVAHPEVTTSDVPPVPLVTERVIPIKIVKNEPKTQRQDEASNKSEAKCNKNDEKQRKSEETAENAKPPQPKSDQKRKTPLEIVEDVCADVERLRLVILNFEGMKGGKDYLYLDEMLTRNLIRLDNIETEGNDGLRQLRRTAVAAIQECIRCLEQRAVRSNVNDVQMESESAPNETEQSESNVDIYDNESDCHTDTIAKQQANKLNKSKAEKETDTAVEEVQMEAENVVDESKPMEETHSTNPVDDANDGMQLKSADEKTAKNQQETSVSTDETVSS